MKVDTFDDLCLEETQYEIALLAHGCLDPDREDVCESLSQGFANHPNLLDWLQDHFKECDQNDDTKEVEARILSFFRNDQRAIDYLDSLKTHYHDDLAFKVMEPQEYKPSPRVPDSEVIAL